MPQSRRRQLGQQEQEVMRINEILLEAREAPLYHFTQEGKFYSIILKNVMRSPGGKIYFTRDYARQFAPDNIMTGTWGLRINQDKLRQKFGRKLQAGGQNAISDKERQQWLNDPANAEVIDKIKQGGSSGETFKGIPVKQLVLGTVGANKRWESEEWLLTDKLENLDQYITGIVYAGGRRGEAIAGDQDHTKRSVKANDALTGLAQQLMVHWKGKKEWELRDILFDYMIKHGIPFVYQRQDFPAKQVRSKMFELGRERKSEKERRSKEDSVLWIARDSVSGGATVKAPADDPVLAAKRALTDNPRNFVTGIAKMQLASALDKEWEFEEPYKDPKKEPKIKKSP